MSGWNKWFKRRDAAPDAKADAPEPAMPEAALPEAAAPEPAEPEPAPPEPAQPEPAQPEPAQPEPTPAEPALAEPASPLAALPNIGAAFLACEASRQQLAAPPSAAQAPRDAPTELLNLNRWYQDQLRPGAASPGEP